MLQIKTCTLDNPRCVHLNLRIFVWAFLTFFLLTLPTYPCWMSSLSFATFLSSITVKHTTQNSRDVYPVVPQEQPSLMTGSMQRLITSLVSQTNSRRGKTLAKRGIHSITRAQHSLTSSDFFTELGIADETVQLLRGLLQHSGVHWEGTEVQVTARLQQATRNTHACYR